MDASSANPTPPYTNWATAAQFIQNAVDAAAAGDEIVVTNGVYVTGGRAVGTNVLVNRVAVDKPLTLRSVNGPEFTVIQGYQVPGTTNGDSAIRCVYLTNGASLFGFTLTKGATRSAALNYWEDSSRQRRGGGVLCESTNVVVSNCLVAGNSAADSGGGAWGGTLNNCTLTSNWAGGEFPVGGGGAAGSTLNNCTLIGNSSAGWGGGAFDSILNNCTLTANSAADGGGATWSTLNNCTLTGNSAGQSGGGAKGSALNNCLLTGNWADGWGGGASDGTLNNCTLTGNSAGRRGGGASGTAFYHNCELNNCVVYFNTAPTDANYGTYIYNTTLMNYCCTTPMPANGVGNMGADPQLASASHLSAFSPCRGAGSAAYATGTDIDGEPWASPPSIGCDEYLAGAVTGPLSVKFVADYTNVAAGFAINLTALIEGRTAASAWDFDDGVVVSNQPYGSHAWTAPGDYAVVLRAYNENSPAGVSATVTIHVVAQPVHYVAADSTNPLPPYASWATAATTIQDAVDAATVAGALVLVTNGVYATGAGAVYGTMTNRVAVDKPLALRSVNGPQFTFIQGYQVPGTTNGNGAIRCVYLTGGASLSGFTLTNGATRSDGDYDCERSGGGLWCESPNAVVINCVLAGNSAADSGGGAYYGTLNNCTLTGNSAYAGGGASGGTLNDCILTGNSAGYGGGAYGGTLNDCTLTGNSAADSGGGACWGTLNNCVAYFNTATNGANFDYGTLNYCCTTPMPTNGLGNITNAPLFADYPGGNLRLQSNSPCINAAHNDYAPGLTDLDGNPRIVSGTVDIGAYEFQGPGSVISYAWLQQYGLPPDGSADSLDLDADGHNNWQEWRCLTDPTNALSVLRLLAPESDGTNVTVRWASVAGVTYFLERSTNLSANPPFTLLAQNLPGQPGMTTYTDTNAASLASLFFRVGVAN